MNAGFRSWQRDVIDGVTRRIAIAAIPGLVAAIIVRTLRGDWVLVALVGWAAVALAAPLSPKIRPQTRALIIVAVFVWCNAVVMVYGREIPFHGIFIPMGAAFAALMGGLRWGAWTLAVLSATWLLPWLLVVSGLPAPFEIAWQSQYLRLWFMYTCLSAGIVASILHVIRHLEQSLERGDRLVERVRIEARAVQALTGRVREAEEIERGRLARELHDDFGQRLTALRMKLQLAQMKPQTPASTLDECVTISEDLLRDMRSFARGLRPPLLDEVGLAPALRALFELHSGGPALALDLDIPTDAPRLPQSTELAIFRVFQEALANVLRHADATRLSLELKSDDRSVTARLTDNGRGFDPLDAERASASGHHLGLVSMQERAAFIGAELEVSSAPGRGTTIRLRVPRIIATADPDRQPAAVVS
jgi:signal transduction histidine kinase